MTINSMTGFARSGGNADGMAFHWELRSVNGRGLDIRFRLPPGYDAIEGPAREAASKRFARGNITATLVIEAASESSGIRINQQALTTILAAIEDLQNHARFDRPRPEAILGLRGVIEPANTTRSDEEQAKRQSVVLGAFRDAINGLAQARAEEGARLAPVLDAALVRIEDLTNRIAAHPSRRPELISERLAQQIRRLVETDVPLEPDRLHQEAILAATRADVEEELKRLTAHVAAGRELLAETVATGRRLDFLAQEFNREANTICSKANDIEITRMGLDLKAVIDQLREQVQNIE